MDEVILRDTENAEFSTEERCYITELSNSEREPHASIARERVPVGITTRWHRPQGIAERCVILKGAGQGDVGKLGPQRGGPGDVVLIPPSCRQRIACLGDEDLVILAICTPRSRQDAYEDVDGTA